MSALDKQASPQNTVYLAYDGQVAQQGPKGGLTIRQHAAITLRVPMSGDQELDAMIREARRMDMATAAMHGLLSDGYDIERAAFAQLCYANADALLGASETKKAEPELAKALSGSKCECEGYGLCARCLSDDADATSGWIEWNGGECPVDECEQIAFKQRDGLIGRALAANCCWLHVDNDGGDIIAYRIVKE